MPACSNGSTSSSPHSEKQISSSVNEGCGLPGSVSSEPVDIVDLANDDIRNPAHPLSTVVNNAIGIPDFTNCSHPVPVKPVIPNKGTTGLAAVPATTSALASIFVKAATTVTSTVPTNLSTLPSNGLFSRNSNPITVDSPSVIMSSVSPMSVGSSLLQSTVTVAAPNSVNPGMLPISATSTSTSSTLVTASSFQPPLSVPTTLPPTLTDSNTNSARLPSISTPLPPHFPFTLSPISPNGDFPAVQFSLPGFPMVILQVLPLPGARMGEHYTINVPTQLILNGVASAIANGGGTANGGPIVLSIAPSGTVPPGVIPPTPATLPPPHTQSVGSTPFPESLLSLSADSGIVSGDNSLSQTSSPPTSVSCPTVQQSSNTSVIPNTMGSLHFPSLVISQPSTQNNTITTSGITTAVNNNSINNNSNINKRMRAIAPKPSQKLTMLVSANTNTSSASAVVSSRSAVTAVSRNNNKRQIIVTAVCTPSTSTVSTATGTPVLAAANPQTAISTIKSSQLRKVSIMPAGVVTSASRHGRGRRKGASNPTLPSNINSIISSFPITNGLPGATPASNATQSIISSGKNELGITTHGSLQSLSNGTATTLPPLPAPLQQTNPVQSMFPNQPLLMSGPNGTSMLAGPMLPASQVPPAFLFGNALPTFNPGGAAPVASTSSSSGAAPPYLFPQPLPLPNGCSQFPVSMYNPVSCTTSMSLSNTGNVAVVRSLQAPSSGSLFPPGAPTALATVDPASGMVTHFPTPCMPMTVPYSSTGPSSDPGAFTNLPTMLYSQSGLLLPNASASQGSMVYPVPGQSLLSTATPIPSIHAPAPVATSNTSVICPSQSGLGQPFSTAFMSSCSSSTLLPNGTLTTPFQVPSAFTSMIAEQQAFTTSIQTGFDPMQQQQPPHASLLAHSLSSTITSTSAPQFVTSGSDVVDCGAPLAVASEVATGSMGDDNTNNLVKDDLITLAWRLTQMKGQEADTNVATNDASELIESSGDENSGGMLGSLFDTYADQAYSYPSDLGGCNVVLSEVGSTNLDNIGPSGLNEETDEIVLLDGKSPASVSELRNDADTYGTRTGAEESTGNADIDALLAAAAMVGAASGVGDAQSSVTVPVPCSSTFSSVNQQVDSHESEAVVISTTSSFHPEPSVSASSTILTATHTPNISTQPSPKSPICPPSSLISNKTSPRKSPDHTTSTDNVEASCLPKQLHSSKADDILSADFFCDFTSSSCPNGFTDHGQDDLDRFNEVDEPTSLADVLGCNAEDAADLESVLGPEAHDLDGSGHVTDSFLQSLVNASPGLGLDGADEDDADVDGEGTHLFDPDFGVCDPLDDGVPSSTVEKEHRDVTHTESKNPVSIVSDTQFELDLDAFTKSGCQPDNSVSDHSIPVPSSQQVRSLFQNTSVPHRRRSHGPPCDLTRTASAESKLLSLFDSGSRRHGAKNHRLAPEDDFLTVDFADADGDYTTAEQFNEALLLLGPQPSSPMGLHLSYSKPIIEESHELQLLAERPDTEKSEVKARSQAEGHSTTTANVVECSPSPMCNARILFFPKEQELYVECEQVEFEQGSVSYSAAITVTTEDFNSANLRPLLEIMVSQPLETVTIEITPTFIFHDAVAQSDCSIQPVTKFQLLEDHETVPNSSTPTVHEEVESIPASQEARPSKTPIIPESCDNRSEDSDGDVTLAMTLDSNRKLVLEHTSPSSEELKTQQTSTKKQVSSYHIRSTEPPVRTRSVSLTSPLELAASTPNKEAGSGIGTRRNRRRLFSAPSNVPPEEMAVSRNTRHSASRRSSLNKSNSLNRPTSFSLESQKPSTSPNVISSSTEQSSQPSVDESATQLMQAHSILTVLASSSALLETAVDLESDSDVSPVKSSLGLDTLDRMLKNCQKRSQQTLEDTSESKSSMISSTESDSAVTFQVVVEQTAMSAHYQDTTEDDQLMASGEVSTGPETTDMMNNMNNGGVALTLNCKSSFELGPSAGIIRRRRRRRRRVIGKRTKKSMTEEEQLPSDLNWSETVSTSSAVVPLEGLCPMKTTDAIALSTQSSSRGSQDPLCLTSSISSASSLLTTGLLFGSSDRPHSFG